MEKYLDKKKPKKLMKRKRDPYFKDESLSIIQPDKKRLHKRSRSEWKKVLKENL